MVNIKSFLFILLASVLAGETEDNCYDVNYTIKNQQDAKNIRGCVTIPGSLIVSSEFDGELDLPNLYSVGSGVFISGAKIEKINLSNLSTVGILNITNVPDLRQLNVDNLYNIGSLNFKNLGELSLDFKNSLQMAENIEITDSKIQTIKGINVKEVKRLKLSSLSGINQIEFSSFTGISFLEIKDLPIINTISFPNLGSIKKDAYFTNNPKAFISMPKLKNANSKLFYDGIKEIDTINLEFVMELKYKNVEFTSIVLEKLEFIKNADFINNDYLQSIYLTKLVELVNFSVQGNKKLTQLLTPNLKKVDTLRIIEPELTEFKYNSSMEGKKSNIVASINCEPFKKLSFTHDCKDSRQSSTSIKVIKNNSNSTPKKDSIVTPTVKVIKPQRTPAASSSSTSNLVTTTNASKPPISTTTNKNDSSSINTETNQPVIKKVTQDSKPKTSITTTISKNSSASKNNGSTQKVTDPVTPVPIAILQPKNQVVKTFKCVRNN